MAISPRSARNFPTHALVGSGALARKGRRPSGCGLPKRASSPGAPFLVRPHIVGDARPENLVVVVAGTRVDLCVGEYLLAAPHDVFGFDLVGGAEAEVAAADAVEWIARGAAEHRLAPPAHSLSGL